MPVPLFLAVEGTAPTPLEFPSKARGEIDAPMLPARTAEGEDDKIPEYRFSDVEYNEGMLLGCINCYIYQACETEDFFETDLYRSLQTLKEAILERLIKEKGQDIPWGID